MKFLEKKNMGELNYRFIPENDKTGYFYYAPEKIKRVLVAVHGISRNAEEIINSFCDLADIHGILIVAPVFRKDFAKDYQRLGRRGKGPRSDYQLLAMLRDVKEHLNVSFRKISMFGFSAGAQFAHRFAFAHPQIVDKLVLVAAGWYTFPDKKTSYPYGLRLHDEFTDIEFDLKRFLRLKFKVFVGNRDNLRETSLNKNKIIDQQQGRTRIERAQKWVKSMNRLMSKQNIPNEAELEQLKGVGHQFSEGVEKDDLHIKAISWIVG